MDETLGAGTEVLEVVVGVTVLSGKSTFVEKGDVVVWSSNGVVVCLICCCIVVVAVVPDDDDD